MLTTKWIALPTWLLTQCFRPLLRDTHPWKKQFFALADWHAGRTPLTRQYDMVLWFVILAECIMIWHLITQL